MQTSLPQRAFAHSLRTLKRARGHPRQWAPAVMPDVPLPDFAVAPVLPLPSGWAPPQGPSLALPFRVTRTTKGNQIPVYTDFKNGRTRELTVVRRIEGDAAALAKELYRVTGGAAVEVRPGRVEVSGGRSKEIKSWLAGLGF